MLFRILSDLHLDFDPNFKLVHHGEDIVLCAGDLSSARERGLAEGFIASSAVPFYYTLGNHDSYHGDQDETIDFYRQLERKYKHFHFLLCGVIDLGACLLVGTPLWTDFNLYGDPIKATHIAKQKINDFRLISHAGHPIRPEYYVQCFDAAVATIYAAKDYSKPVVVMTHWCPSAQTVSPIYARDPLNAFFTSNCEHLMGGNVKLWVHGHSHVYDDRVINGTRVIRNPKGYPQERVNWNHELIVSLPEEDIKLEPSITEADRMFYDETKEDDERVRIQGKFSLAL